VIVELLHSHHWIYQEGCQVDVDVSKLRLLNARKPTLDIRLRDQPVGPTVNTILESETQHESEKFLLSLILHYFMVEYLTMK
jgi:hypothetical protein